MIAESLRPPKVNGFKKPAALPGETIYCNENWRRVEPTLSILVPMYHDNASPLIERLNRCKHAENIEIAVYDDGTADAGLTHAVQEAMDAFSGAAMLVSAQDNKGRAAGRNRLEEVARSDWMVYLDADMLPDDSGFIARYLKIIKEHGQPVMAVGGFSLAQINPTPATELHWHQCAASECVPAEIRSENPGRFVFTSNVLVHRDIMTVVPFDPAFTGWGWEDVDWGSRAMRRFPVIHLNNTATHLGLDTTANLLRKYQNSGKNFWLAADRHPDALKRTPLYMMSRTLSYVPGHSLIRWMAGGLARLPRWIAPLSLRLFALKLYRAAAYAGARHA